MSGFQDEKSAGGGAVEKKKVVQIARPDAGAVQSEVDSQIAQAKQAHKGARSTAKDAHADKKDRIIGAKLDQLDGAEDNLYDGIDKARAPVNAADAKIAEIKKQLAAAELERDAKQVVFSAKKGELKTAYKQAVSAIKTTAAGHIAAIEGKRDEAYDAAAKALETVVSEGGDRVEAERALAQLHDDWQAKMKWEGRKAGFNAVAETVKEIIKAVQTTYRDNRDAARAGIEIPAELLERHNKNNGPTAP